MSMMFEDLLQQLNRSLSQVTWAFKDASKRLEKIHIKTVFDLLKHLPTGCLTRRYVHDIDMAAIDELIILPVTITGHHVPMHRRLSKGKPYIIEALNNQTFIQLVFFNTAAIHYLPKIYQSGQSVLISGRPHLFQGNLTFTHPEIFKNQKNLIDGFSREPIYPLTAGVTQPMIHALLKNALNICPDLPEWMAPATQKLIKAPSWKVSINQIHWPQNEQDISPAHPARMRLAYDELLANQLTLLTIRRVQKKRRGQAYPISQHLRPKFLTQLPFQLTKDQIQVIKEIDSDLISAEPMMRLLQGDVGSGKTVVAMMIMLNVIEQGGQIALMAPTEILARQHAEVILGWACALNISAAVLTGRDKAGVKSKILTELADNRIKILIGTHALIQEHVIFKNLGLVVIDEQHRFGVNQRLTLVEKGHGVNVLSMTATPIPRTLMLGCYGDVDCSTLREKPAMRKPIETLSFPLDRLDEIINGMQRALAQNHKIYWVCPLVSESENLDLAAVEQRFKTLQVLYDSKVGLIHGKMKDEQKSQVMAEFKLGTIRILVSTTVIEVGVDVPDATIMVIEHAERFGLAQMHQLRGRVGRGDAPGICMLLYHAGLTLNARKRIEIMRQSNDGFYLAECDLKLRGAGDLSGLKQSGMPSFSFADLSLHQDVLKLAHRDAQNFLEIDPLFQSPQGQSLKLLLKLFDKQESLRYLSAV